MIGNFIGAPIGGAVNTSGTLYAQAVSAAGSGSLALTRSAGKQASLATTATVSLARAIAHALGITGPTVLTARKVVSHHGPSISSTGTATISFTKRIQQAIAVATAGILSVSFHAGRVVMLHMTAMGSVSFVKTIATTLESITASSAVQAIKSVSKVILTSSVVSVLVEFKKALYAPLTHLVSASRTLGAALFGGGTKIDSTSAGGKTSGAKSGGEQN